MKNYITKSNKRPLNQKLINEALNILELVGIPFDKTQKGLQSMAMCFLAVAGVTKSWKEAKGQNENRHLKTRDMIKYVNEFYEENISPGSYDDVRRKHLKSLVWLADLIINSAKNPNAATNDPTRGYTLHSDFRNLVINYGTPQWDIKLKLFLKNRPSLTEIFARKKQIKKIPIIIPGGQILEFSQGGHNQLQREIIEEFLPRFGQECILLYIGDTSNKYLYKDDIQLKELGFFDLSHEALPDIVAFDKKKNWLYLIEAVYSSGPMSEERVFELKKGLLKCSADLIFITAFTSRSDFKKYFLQIAWETEVWTADNPEHLTHFNGDKFLGPHK